MSDIGSYGRERALRDPQFAEGLEPGYAELKAREGDSKMIQRLDDILESLVSLESDRVTLEWETGGIEVMMFRGSTGVGGLLTGPLAGAIMAEVVTRAKLEGRTKGLLKARIQGRQRRFVAKGYDHFGETAFELRVRR